MNNKSKTLHNFIAEKILEKKGKTLLASTSAIKKMPLPTIFSYVVLIPTFKLKQLQILLLKKSKTNLTKNLIVKKVLKIIFGFY